MIYCTAVVALTTWYLVHVFLGGICMICMICIYFPSAICKICAICVYYLRDGICTICTSDHKFASVGSVWSAWSAYVSPAGICVIGTICLMSTGTYLCGLQFQVDFMHNISIAAEKDIEVWNVHILLLNMFSERDLYYLRDLCILLTWWAVSYTHLTLPTNREV